MSYFDLDTFIAIGIGYGRANRHVNEPDFDHLYVRYGPRYILVNDDMIKFDHVLDIANVAVDEEKRGKGVFTALIARLQKDYPGLHIFVENAARDFQRLLLRLGFTQQPSDCFFLESKTKRPRAASIEPRAGSWREKHPELEGRGYPNPAEGDE